MNEVIHSEISFIDKFGEKVGDHFERETREVYL